MKRFVPAEISQQLELFEAQEIIRPDINVAKWAGLIFSSPWARDLYDEKEICFELPSGERASITITPAKNRKRPTTTTQRVFYALLQVWEQSGRPANGRFPFSARQIAHVLGWKWAGRDTASRIQEHLDILDKTSLDWLRTFVNGEYLDTYNEGMNLVDAKSYLTRKKMNNKEFFYGQHNVRLNQDLVENMIAGRTKPVKYLVFISIKNDGAAKLYNLLDNFLSKKGHWERRSKALISDDLELSGSRYKDAFARHKKLKELKSELDGKELSTGAKLAISISKTADNEDYKLIVRKISASESKRRFPKKAANDQDSIPHIVDDLMKGLEFVGSVKLSSRKWLEYCCLWYSRDMLFMALGLLKGDYRGNVKTSVIQAYSYVLHRLVHERGLEWVKECGTDCPYRPENLKKLDFKK